MSWLRWLVLMIAPAGRVTPPEHHAPGAPVALPSHTTWSRAQRWAAGALCDKQIGHCWHLPDPELQWRWSCCVCPTSTIGVPVQGCKVCVPR